MRMVLGFNGAVASRSASVRERPGQNSVIVYKFNPTRNTPKNCTMLGWSKALQKKKNESEKKKAIHWKKKKNS